MSSAGLRRSPRGAPRKAHANRQRVPPRWGTPAIAAPRGHQAVTLPPPPAPPAWLPLRISDSPAGGTGGPGTPPLSVRRAAAGRAFPLGRSLRPLPGAPGRSPAHAGALAPWPPAPLLHRLPAAGCAACAPCAPAPQRKGCCDRKRPRGTDRTGSGPVPGPNSAYNVASVIRNCQSNWRAADPLHSYNPRYTHNRAGQASGSKRPRATSSNGKAALRPPAERPSAAARCCRCPGRAGGRGGRHHGPQLLHAAQQHGPGKAGRPPSRAPAPAHPAQRKQQQSRACRPGFPAAEA